MLEQPLKWRKPQKIFVNRISDRFHPDVPDEYILRVFDVMKRASWHQFQVLTKPAERLAKLSGLIYWPSNVWMGVSVESKKYLHRMKLLAGTGAKTIFVD